MKPLTKCNADLIRDSLADRLSEQQEEDLAAHLCGCAACREQLERLAAAQDEWSRVQDVLRRDAHTRAANTGTASALVSDADAPPSPISASLGEGESCADFAVDFLDPSPRPGALGRLGNIDIHCVIGRGGMGVVLKGFQEELNRPVAVKVLAPHLATSGAARRRFAREAQAAAAIMHPNVMPILTVNSSAKLPFLVMPFATCESLQQRLDRDGPLPVVDILRIGLQVARGLAAAHAQGLIHRDVKPANILLEQGVDRVMLTDFGLARAADDASLTRSGVIAGTPQYMSPEQARGEPIDARSDLFSLGSVLYTMSAGRPPFRAETSYGILRRVTDDAPRPLREINPDIPDWLQSLVRRLHSKQAADRYANAVTVAALLEQCLAHVEQPTVAALPDELRTPSRRRTRAALVAIIAACALISGWMASATLFREAAAPPAQQQAEVAPPVPAAADQDTSAPPPTAVPRWDDGLDAQLRAAAHELDRLQEEVNQP